eukprot:7318029-Prymnesium_polylepis.1
MAAYDRWRRIRSRCPRGCGQGGRAPASWFPGRPLAGQRCERIAIGHVARSKSEALVVVCCAALSAHCRNGPAEQRAMARDAQA